jgi:hypothetical protein
MKWEQDKTDYSWFATDGIGCEYRIAKVLVSDSDGSFRWHWVAAWMELNAPRIGSTSYESAEQGMKTMDSVCARGTVK